MILLAGYSIISVFRRDHAGFGILFYLLALSITANIFFPVGTFMAERFLFLPSVGIILTGVILLVRGLGKNREKIYVVMVVVLTLFFSILTLIRNPAWQDNLTLMQTDLPFSPNSAKLRNDLGTILLEKALSTADSIEQASLFREAFQHLVKAAELHPTYYDAYLAKGACAYYIQEYSQSVNAYRMARQLYPEDHKPKTGLWYALQAEGTMEWNKGSTIKAITLLTEAWYIQPDAAIAKQVSRYYRALDQQDKAIEWADRSDPIHK
jgi:tetratricopeptide (TPR) repeat protein